MNRRELLAVAGATVLTAKGLAGCSPPPDKRYLELRIAGNKSDPPYRVTEVGADGKPVGTLNGDDHKGIGLFLARTFMDPAATKQLRMVVQDGATLEHLVAITHACVEAGFQRLKYYGCIPPGCGIPAGGEKNPARSEGLEYNTKQLLKVASLNLIKC